MAAVETKDGPEITKEKCTADANFAVVCAFIEQFGEMCGVLCPSIGRLQVSQIDIIYFICYLPIFWNLNSI